jgi:predicted Ser/Thr protein kinase
MQVDTLGRYRIDKELGRGAMGRVFLAYDPQIERKVAIKTIQILAALPAAEREAARERFLREGRSAGKLLPPGIVTIFDVGEADGVPYLAMEYVEGRTLDTYCRPETLLPVAAVVGLIASAAEALAFAHRNGIVHRDVKPSNLMRVGETSVKIMDFGLAKSQATSMTHDGSLLGTPNYMSPEQIRGDVLDGRSDLFSLAVVLYEMLTGEKPFAGDSVSSVLYRIVHEPPRQAELHLDRVPPSLAAFLSRALSKAPDDRFADGTVFAATLRRAGAAGGAAQSVAKTPSAAAGEHPSRRAASATGTRSRWPWIAGALLVVAGLAVLATRLPGWLPAPRVALLTAPVRTEPPGGVVLLNGTPLTAASVSFPADGPFGVLSAKQGCREVKHRLEPADAGREIVLAVDPLTAEVTVDPGAPNARVAVNGKDAGPAPVTVALDLCRDNVLEAAAATFRPAAVTIAAQATPLVARTTAAGMKLEPLPMGRLRMPPAGRPMAFTLDGKDVPRSGPLDVPAGTHTVRAVDAEHFVDVSATVDVPEGGEAIAKLEMPALAHLVVQTFPPNCRVMLRRDGTTWRPIGDSPLRYDVAPGRYALKVESPIDGTTRENELTVRPGDNPPVRISFGRPDR